MIIVYPSLLVNLGDVPRCWCFFPPISRSGKRFYGRFCNPISKHFTCLHEWNNHTTAKEKRIRYWCIRVAYEQIYQLWWSCLILTSDFEWFWYIWWFAEILLDFPIWVLNWLPGHPGRSRNQKLVIACYSWFILTSNNICHGQKFDPSKVWLSNYPYWG